MLGTFHNWMVILERTLQAGGHDLPSALRAAAIEVPSESAGARLPVALTRQIWSVAEQASADPVLGLSMLTQINFTDFGELGVVMLAGGSLPQIMERIARFHRLLTDAMHYELAEDAEVLTVTIHTNGDPHWRAVEFAAGLIIGLLRFRLDAGLAPLSLSFAFDNPAGQEAYEGFFGCPVEQGAAATVLVLPLAGYRQAPAGSEVARHFEPVLVERLASLEAGTGWVPKVAARVRQHLVDTETEPTLAGVAASLHVSPRSLQRHLAAEGTSFQDVLDESRQALARQWLSAQQGGRARNMTELAIILGFSSSSAFSRAFRRWFGMTPGQAAKGGLAGC